VPGQTSSRCTGFGLGESSSWTREVPGDRNLFMAAESLQLYDILGLEAFGAFGNIELNLITFVE
jgi:hypothetical protein